MSARECIRGKTPFVQVLLKAHMTRWSLVNPGDDYEALGGAALEWWDRIKPEPVQVCGGDEEKAAELVLDRLRTGNSTWARILAEEPLLKGVSAGCSGSRSSS